VGGVGSGEPQDLPLLQALAAATGTFTGSNAAPLAALAALSEAEALLAPPAAVAEGALALLTLQQLAAPRTAAEPPPPLLTQRELALSAWRALPAGMRVFGADLCSVLRLDAYQVLLYWSCSPRQCSASASRDSRASRSRSEPLTPATFPATFRASFPAPTPPTPPLSPPPAPPRADGGRERRGGGCNLPRLGGAGRAGQVQELPKPQVGLPGPAARRLLVPLVLLLLLLVLVRDGAAGHGRRRGAAAADGGGARLRAARRGGAGGGCARAGRLQSECTQCESERVRE
jgi:hypothetical protein